MAASYEQVFENNKKWLEGRKDSDGNYFEELAKGQSPDFLYIGCADSRVPVNEIMGVDPGEVFVHRNVANLVNNIDLNVMSCIEYAVAHLKVKHVVVCGHYGCGGVKAAMQAQDLGMLNPWLRNIRDVYRIHQTELDAIGDEDKRYERLIELNVQEQCINVAKTAVVQKAYAENKLPEIHGWVFDLASGELKDLKIDMANVMKGIGGIYNLGHK